MTTIIKTKHVDEMTFGETQKSIKAAQKSIENQVQLEMIEDEMGDGEYEFIDTTKQAQNEVDDEVALEMLGKEGDFEFVNLTNESLLEVEAEIEAEIDFDEQAEILVKDLYGKIYVEDHLDNILEVICFYQIDLSIEKSKSEFDTLMTGDVHVLSDFIIKHNVDKAQMEMLLEILPQ